MVNEWPPFSPAMAHALTTQSQRTIQGRSSLCSPPVVHAGERGLALSEPGGEGGLSGGCPALQRPKQRPPGPVRPRRGGPMPDQQRHRWARPGDPEKHRLPRLRHPRWFQTKSAPCERMASDGRDVRPNRRAALKVIHAMAAGPTDERKSTVPIEGCHGPLVSDR